LNVNAGEIITQQSVDSSSATTTTTITTTSTTLETSTPTSNRLLTIRGGAVATATTTTINSSKNKLSNLQERTLSAAIMLGGLILWIDTFREKGMIFLVLVVQIGLFREATDVVLPHPEFRLGNSVSNSNNNNGNASRTKTNRSLLQPTSSIKWWWYVAYELALVGPRLLSTKRDGSVLMSARSIYLCSFMMVALGIVSFVVTLNNTIAFSYEFQMALQELASYHLAIVFTVVPASFWIATIQDYGMKWVLYSLYLVMINDTMAYVFGATFGKHPLLPTISPKKTWEGFFGALVSTMGASILLWKKMGFVEVPSGTAINHALIIAAYCSILAPFGGFMASITKRAYGKKDFSNLIAGHGGFVDRLDCQLMTAPFIYLYLCRFVRPFKH